MRYYELVHNGWDGTEHYGFFKSIEECLLSSEEIANKDILVWDFVDGLPVKAGQANISFDKFDEYFEQDKPTLDSHAIEKEIFGYTHDYYTFDDGVVTLTKTKGVK